MSAYVDVDFSKARKGPRSGDTAADAFGVQLPPRKKVSPRRTFPADRGSPFAFTLWMGAGCVALFLIATSKKKTPIDTVQGLPPYQGPRRQTEVVGIRNDEDRAQHWEKLAQDCEKDAKNPRYAKEKALNLELAADYRRRAAETRKGQ